MATERRVLRLQQLILETVATTLQREVNDPRIGFISVTRVKLASDLSSAIIGWSVMGSEAEQRTTERALEAVTPLVQRVVAKTLQTRVTPKLQFRHDGSLNRAQELDSIFEQLRQERAELGRDEDDPDAAADGDATSEDGA
jgi:ribosome-binding factor A